MPACVRSTSLFDLKVHSVKTSEEADALDLRKIWFDLREKVEGMDFTECRANGSHMVSFTHLTAGYDAGYYSYLRSVPRFLSIASNPAYGLLCFRS